MVRTQINLEEEQYRFLALEAKRLKRSLSALIRESIDDKYTRKKKAQRSNASILMSLAKNAVDTEIPKDMIENMDDYLYGKKSKWEKFFRMKKKIK